MKVIAEFEKPAKCEECPCFYQTEGAYYDECRLTHKEIENYFIVDESCPLKVKENERMTGEEKIMSATQKKAFDEWIKDNGGEGGALYMTFSDEELEKIFLTAYERGKHEKEQMEGK